MSAMMGNGLAGMLNVMGGVGQQMPAGLQQAVQQQVSQANAALNASKNAQNAPALTADQMEAIAASLQAIEMAISEGLAPMSSEDRSLFDALRMTLALSGVKIDPTNHPSYLQHCREVVVEEEARQEIEWQKQARREADLRLRLGTPSQPDEWQYLRSGLQNASYQGTREQRAAMLQQRQEAQRYFNEQFNIAALQPPNILLPDDPKPIEEAQATPTEKNDRPWWRNKMRW